MFSDNWISRLPICYIHFSPSCRKFSAISPSSVIFKSFLIYSTPRRKLRCTNKEPLVVPTCKYNLETYGKRAFSVIASILWNDLPYHIRTTTCLSTFKSRVKTFIQLFPLNYCYLIHASVFIFVNYSHY